MSVTRIPLLSVLFFCLSLLAGPALAADASTAAASGIPNLKPFTEGGPFVLNVLDTTPNAKAWADIIQQPSNFLNCSGREIALCYYSGPAGPVPCRPRADGTEADCTCYVIPAKTAGKANVWKVAITSILNLPVYQNTIKTCDSSGKNCGTTNQADVCASLNKGTFYPGTKLVSTFSTYLAEHNKLSLKQISCPSGRYAGCMTAPCKKLNKKDASTGLELAECVCPIWNGPFQIAEGDGNAQCTLDNDHVWSAAYHEMEPAGK